MVVTVTVAMCIEYFCVMHCILHYLFCTKTLIDILLFSFQRGDYLEKLDNLPYIKMLESGRFNIIKFKIPMILRNIIYARFESQQSRLEKCSNVFLTVLAR